MTAKARAAVVAAWSRLETADARLEHLGMVQIPRRIFGVQRAARIVPHGRVWRLGAVMIGTDGRLWATGATTRVTEPGRPQHLSSSAERRRAERSAALAGGFSIGDVVNHGAKEIMLERGLCEQPTSATLSVDSGETWVRWGSTGERTPLGAYLDDQVSLLESPPPGT